MSTLFFRYFVPHIPHATSPTKPPVYGKRQRSVTQYGGGWHCFQSPRVLWVFVIFKSEKIPGAIFEKSVYNMQKMCKTNYMSNWDYKKNSPEAFNKYFVPKSQHADAKRKWVDTQALPMEDIREFEKKVLYNESKNNRN